MIKLPDIEIPSYKSMDFTDNSIQDLMAESQKRALSNGAWTDGRGYSYYVNNNGENILVSREGMKHLVKGGDNVKKNLIVNIGELLQDAVKINEVYRGKENNTSGVYFNEFELDGDKYICRFVVYDKILKTANPARLHAANEQLLNNKRRNSVQAAYQQNVEKTQLIRIPSKVSKKELIDDVNNSFYKNDLPLDTIYKFNSNYIEQPQDLKGHKYSFGTSLNRLDSSKELKSKAVGYNS